MEEIEVNLSELIEEDTIKLDLNVNSKNEAIEALVDLLFSNKLVKSKEGFLKDVYMREEQGLTGIGNGIAIPHGKSEAVNKTSITIGRLNKAVEWETLDEKPVETVILFAVKESDKNNLHLKILAKIAGALADENTCEKVKKANNAKEIIVALNKNS